MDELEARLFLHGLASVASRPQFELAALRLQGYSIVEVAQQHGLTPKRVRRCKQSRKMGQISPQSIPVPGRGFARKYTSGKS